MAHYSICNNRWVSSSSQESTWGIVNILELIDLRESLTGRLHWYLTHLQPKIWRYSPKRIWPKGIKLTICDNYKAAVAAASPSLPPPLLLPLLLLLFFLSAVKMCGQETKIQNVWKILCLQNYVYFIQIFHIIVPTIPPLMLIFLKWKCNHLWCGLMVFSEVPDNH